MDKQVGFRHHRWTVVGPKEYFANGRVYYLCECDCGTVKHLRSDALNRSACKSCGCNRKDMQRSRLTKHGHTTVKTHTTTYEVWSNIIARCYNSNNKAFEDYGGRGITTCLEWRDFRNFLSDMGERPHGLFIDRFDSNKPYSKNNCKWSTREQQNRNYAKKSVYYQFMGFSFIQKDWARMFGVDLPTFRKWKLDYGFSMEEIATKTLIRGTWNGKIDFSFLKFYNQYENYNLSSDEIDNVWTVQEKYLTPMRGRKPETGEGSTGAGAV